MLIAIIFAILWHFIYSPTAPKEDDYVNVYDWYGMLTKEIIHQFEQETGIKVRYDIYDNNEVLEAKLLASNSGYDVVFPSASPYVAWQIQAQVYQPINKKLLTNLKGIDPQIVEKMQDIDKDMTFAIPYYWGTIGFAVNVDKVDKLLPNVNLETLSNLLNPDILKILESHGISLLEEAVDIFPSVLIYLGLDPLDTDHITLTKVIKHLKLIRPYIKRFTSSRFINDLVMGDICLAHAWSGEALQAIQEAKESGKNLKYILPQEGGILWIDVIAIPAGAPHPHNAHKFINFMLKPEVAAKISQIALIPTSVMAAKKILPIDIQNNPGIYPSKEMMKKLFLNKPPKSVKELTYERERTRAWAKIRLNQN